MTTPKKYEELYFDEIKGARVYTRLAIDSRLKTEKRLFSRMAADETRHAKWLNRMRRAEVRRRQKKRKR